MEVGDVVAEQHPSKVAEKMEDDESRMPKMLEKLMSDEMMTTNGQSRAMWHLVDGGTLPEPTWPRYLTDVSQEVGQTAEGYALQWISHILGHLTE